MGFRYTGIRVRDLDRSIAFYTTVLGMQVTWRMRIRETGGAIAVLKSPRGSQRLELNWYPPRGRYRVYRQATSSTTSRSRFPMWTVFCGNTAGTSGSS